MSMTDQEAASLLLTLEALHDLDLLEARWAAEDAVWFQWHNAEVLRQLRTDRPAVA